MRFCPCVSDIPNGFCLPRLTLLKALVTLVSASMLISRSSILLFRRKTLSYFLQVLGAGCLLVVVLTHVCEALNLLPLMYWGQRHSVGHYFDLSSAVLGLTLFPTGCLLQALSERQA